MWNDCCMGIESLVATGIVIEASEQESRNCCVPAYLDTSVCKTIYVALRMPPVVGMLTTKFIQMSRSVTGHV